MDESDRKASAAAMYFAENMMEEIKVARQKYPAPNPTLGALAEEFGEVAKAAMELHEGKGYDWKLLYDEAVQVAAMAFRLAFEGDASLNLRPNLDELQQMQKGYQR